MLKCTEMALKCRHQPTKEPQIIKEPPLFLSSLAAAKRAGKSGRGRKGKNEDEFLGIYEPIETSK